MNVLGKTLVAATAIVALALTCIGCGASANGVGVTPTPTTTPTGAATPTVAPARTVAPTPTAAPAATPALLPEGEPAALVPGRYAFPSFLTNPTISFTVPSGWRGHSFMVGKDYGGTGPAAPVLFGWPFDHGFKDPCTDHTPVLPAAGSGAAGLLAVIAGQPGIDAGPVTDATVAGHDGKFVEYTVTADPATCGNGQDGFWIWGSCPAPVTLGCEDLAGDRRYGASRNNRERAYAIDVDGKTVTFFTSQPADLTAADRAELQQVLDSIEFEPAS